ncbi:unnamed protein product [Camellia sinensis]
MRDGFQQSQAFILFIFFICLLRLRVCVWFRGFGFICFVLGFVCAKASSSPSERRFERVDFKGFGFLRWIEDRDIQRV